MQHGLVLARLRLSPQPVEYGSMVFPRLIDNQRGVALITVVLVALAVSSVAVAASMMTLSSTLVRKFSERESMADHGALSGVELGLSALLADGTLYPVTGYTTLEDSVAVLDAVGNPIPGVWRSIHIGPSSDPSRGSIVSEVWNRGGVRAVRRMEVQANSFASYGYFVDTDNSFSPGFGLGQAMFGPVHFNDDIVIWPPSGSDSATFSGEVTVTGTITNAGNGSFRRGYQEGASNVSLPTVDFGSLEIMATSVGLFFSSTVPGPNSAPMRLEFIPVDMDGNPATTDDVEGFVRVYTTSEDRPYVIARVQGGSMLTTPNCGVWNSGLNRFESAENGLLDSIAARAAVDSNRYRCYPGGDVTLNDSTFAAGIGTGSWIPWSGTPVPGLGALRVAAVGFDDSAYLHPYTSAINSGSLGVIYVVGDVAVSGVVAGRVTVVSEDDIIIIDDLVQHTDPGENSCAADMLGLIASDDIVVADNTINTPQRYAGSSSYHTMDDTKDEYLHAVLMALSEFRVHNASSGPSENDNGGLGAEPCEGAPVGRGCLYLTGGILQRDRGLIGDGTGHILRHSYNQCVLQGGPPQFPSTGSFSKRRIVEMDGANFDPITWFTNYQS
jgi:hypothetical protein